MIRFTVCILMALAGGLAAADRPADDNARSVVEAIEELVKQKNVAGAQVVLGTVDSIQLARNFGVGCASDGRPVDDSTLFCIGSCSKMFSAAVVLSLVADGTLELDTPIDRWLPEILCVIIGWWASDAGADAA